MFCVSFNKRNSVSCYDGVWLFVTVVFVSPSSPAVGYSVKAFVLPASDKHLQSHYCFHLKLEKWPVEYVFQTSIQIHRNSRFRLRALTSACMRLGVLGAVYRNDCKPQAEEEHTKAVQTFISWLLWLISEGKKSLTFLFSQSRHENNHTAWFWAPGNVVAHPCQLMDKIILEVDIFLCKFRKNASRMESLFVVSDGWKHTCPTRPALRQHLHAATLNHYLWVHRSTAVQ